MRILKLSGQLGGETADLISLLGRRLLLSMPVCPGLLYKREESNHAAQRPRIKQSTWGKSVTDSFPQGGRLDGTPCGTAPPQVEMRLSLM